MVVSETDLRQCVGIDKEAIEVVSNAFSALARGDATMPPVLSLDIAEHNGEMDVKTAYIKGAESFALKISTGFFDNPKLGLPSLNGMMVLLSARTGVIEALLMDNGYLTDVRTAIAGAVAAQHLAREGRARAGVIGSGLQAMLQIQALKLVRDVERLQVWARDPAKARAYAEHARETLDLPVEIAETTEALVRNSDLVVTTTPSRAPLIRAEWLHPGLHITAMGSDAEHKNELEPACLTAADRFVCDRRAQSLSIGELHHAVATGVVPASVAVDELGEITAGLKPGRSSNREITICDLTGTGVQDTAIALYAYRRARSRGLGTSIEN